MKFFVESKEGDSDIFEAKSKEALIKEMLSNGLTAEDVADLRILTPREYQEREIAKARKKQIEEDNPTLSKQFPRTANELAKTGEAPFFTKSGSDDALSLGGRSIGAIIDGILGDGSFAEDYMQSLGEAKAEDRKRGTIGSVIQGILRDPLLIPGAAIPVKIAAIRNFGSGIKNKGLKFVMDNILKPAAEGAVGGGAAGLARPMLTTDEMQLLQDIGMGAGSSVALQGIGKLLGKGLSQAEYEKLLLGLANKNKVKPEFLDAAATPEGRAKIPKHYKTQAQIADDLLNYKFFDENKFPENKTVQEFLERSQSKTIPQDAVRHLTEFDKRIIKEAGGGGLNTDETRSAARLKKEAEMFYEPKPEAQPESVYLLDAHGMPIARSQNPPRKAREMNAKQLNNARQRIGKLLEDDFKREAMGRPDGEVKALKDSYFELRRVLMGIAEKEGEETAINAYKSMANKLGAREALFEALRVPENKFVAQDRLTKNLENIQGNNRKTQMQEYFENFDDAFGTDFGDRVKWMNIANALGEGADGRFIQLRDDNNFFTGKGIRKPLTDNLTGRTVASAVKKLEKAKGGNEHGILLGSKKKPTEAEIQAAVIDAISIGLEDEKDIREFVYSRLGSDYVYTDVLGVSTQKRGER